MEENMVSDHWANFGDGNAARIIDTKDMIKEDIGLKIVRFIFLPSIQIERQYDIAEEQHADGTLIREYKAHDVIFLERGVFRTRCFVCCDFNGGETIMTRRYAELTTVLDDTMRLLRTAQGAKARAYQELETESQQLLIALRTKTDMVREVAKARGRTDMDDDDTSADREE